MTQQHIRSRNTATCILNHLLELTQSFRFSFYDNKVDMIGEVFDVVLTDQLSVGVAGTEGKKMRKFCGYKRANPSHFIFCRPKSVTQIFHLFLYVCGCSLNSPLLRHTLMYLFRSSLSDG